MTLDEVQGLSRAFAPVVADAIKQATAPLIERIAELEKRPTLADVEARVERAVSAAVEALPKPTDGRDGADGQKGEPGDAGPAGRDGADVSEEMVARAVEAYLAANPPAAGKDGADGRDGEKGDPGRDADPVAYEDVVRAVTEALTPQEGRLDPVAMQVQRWLEMNPPKDGVDGKDGRDGIDGKDGERGADGKGIDGRDGTDGVGLAGAVIDRSGSLILTLTNGETRDLGRVEGKDGRDGINGERGAAGFSLDDFDTEVRDGGRTLLLKFQQGDTAETHEIGLDVAIYRGVFKAEAGDYQRGDMVTYGGSLWHCNAPTAEPPKEGDKSWTLAAKRGRDGKDGMAGKDGERGAPGLPGTPGRDGKSWG